MSTSEPSRRPEGLPGIPRFGDTRDWWFEKRFGLFVHWGLYALHGFHEQEQWRRRMTRAEYAQLAEEWNPRSFNPDAWLDLAEAAGMSYLCLTTKHHDGFCLWNTAATSFNVMHTPYGRDIVREVADACHRRAIPLCLYYSVVDWHHPDYPNQGRHHELPAQAGPVPAPARYLEFVRAQVRELCTHYGQIHGFWWDMNVAGFADPSVNALIRELQPQAVINDRGFDPGDFGTPERDFHPETAALAPFHRRTEACQSVGSESWGFRRNESYFTDRHLLRGIARHLARDANYLLNVGPNADGEVPPEAVGILQRIGAWYRAVREAFEGVVPVSGLTLNPDILITAAGNFLYVILFRDASSDAVSLKPLMTAPRRATLLNDRSEVAWAVELRPSDHLDQKAYLHLHSLPLNAQANTVLVVRLEFDRPPLPSIEPLERTPTPEIFLQ